MGYLGTDYGIHKGLGTFLENCYLDLVRHQIQQSTVVDLLYEWISTSPLNMVFFQVQVIGPRCAPQLTLRQYIYKGVFCVSQRSSHFPNCNTSTCMNLTRHTEGTQGELESIGGFVIYFCTQTTCNQKHW